MPEVIGFLLFVGVVSVFAFVIWILVRWIDTDDRQARRRQELKAIKEVRASLNHQELFLLVNDLVLLQERGYVEVFPDLETLGRAKECLNNYRQEIGP